MYIAAILALRYLTLILPMFSLNSLIKNLQNYLMAYDMSPYDTMVRKMPLIEQAAREGWTVAWGHDPLLPLGRIVERAAGRYEAVPLE